ncbi:MAG TPA: hypothetical protein DC024_04465 [Clostridiales bacterium]|jgi:hypothetical protein|nr:hypothetical protein [Clostridiales bacterium]HCS10553.1 hypothetical protein [Clostridiales bacterium]
MNKLLLAILIYLLSAIYYIVSEKILYLCTLKYYSLIRNITDDRRAMTILNDKFIRYRRKVRYLRIHVATSSIIATVHVFIESGLIIDLITITIIAVGIITAIDILTLKARFVFIEDKLYRIHNNIPKDNA